MNLARTVLRGIRRAVIGLAATVATLALAGWLSAVIYTGPLWLAWTFGAAGLAGAVAAGFVWHRAHRKDTDD